MPSCEAYMLLRLPMSQALAPLLSPYLLVEDVARRLRCSCRTIHELTRTCAIPHRRLPGGRRSAGGRGAGTGRPRCAPNGCLDSKHAGHPRDLGLPSSSLPVTVDVCRNAQGRMPKMARKPGDLPATLERSLGERVTEGVERSLLTGWTLARDIGLRQHRVELAKKPRRFDVAVLAGTREDEPVVSGLSALTPPSAEEFDDIRSQVDVAPLTILRSVDPPPATRPAHPKHRLPEVDITPEES